MTGFRAFLKSGERPRPTPDPGAAADWIVLGDAVAPIAKDFNAARGRPRFLAILSPTCSLCLHGARSLRDALLHDVAAPKLDLFVVWAPMLTGDDEAAVPGASALVKDARVRQYWDPGRRVGAAFRAEVFPDAVARMRASLPPSHPLQRPFAARDPAQPEWDIYLFFDGAAEWRGQAPRPARFLRQVSLLGGRSVLWSNDYAQAPFEASLAEQLRQEAAALLRQ